MVTQMKYLFFFFHIIQNKFHTRHIPCLHHALALTISTVLHEFQSSGGGIDPLLQMYAPHYSLQSKCNPTISLQFFPFFAIQHSHKDACCWQQHRCLIA
jgi:membrane protein insertase Oxa1/YidC/SpoIIIJ